MSHNGLYINLSEAMKLISQRGWLKLQKNVKKVRCPKCQNLLTELPIASLFKCSSCGAVLQAQARKRGAVNDDLMEKSDSRSVGGGSKKDWVSLGGVSETQCESDQLELPRARGRNFDEKFVDLKGSSSSLIRRNRENLVDLDRTRKGNTTGSKSGKVNKIWSHVDHEYKGSSKVLINNSVRTNNLRRSEYGNSSLENELEVAMPAIGSLTSRPIMEQSSMERNGRTVAEDSRFAGSPYLDGGTSNNPPDSFYSYTELLKNADGLAELARIEDLENDRAGLLLKLNELEDKISRSLDVAGKRKEMVSIERRMTPPPPDPYSGHGAFVPDRYMTLSSDNNFVPTPSFDHTCGSIPYTGRHGVDMQHPYYPSRNVQKEYVGYEDVYRPQMLRRPPNQLAHQYSEELNHDHFPARTADLNQEVLLSHSHGASSHQQPCSCFQCYNRNGQVRPKFIPPAYANQRLLNNATDPNFCSHGITCGPWGCSFDDSIPPQLHSWGQHSHSDFRSESSDNGSCRPRCARRMVMARGNEHVWHPVAGGAPLILCCNCFKLLKLPRKLMMVGKNQSQIRCGACSSIILFEVGNKGLAVPMAAQIKRVCAEVDDGSDEILNESLNSSCDGLNVGAIKSFSNDNSDGKYHLRDTQPQLLCTDQRSSHSDSQKRHSTHSTSSSFLVDEQSPGSVIGQMDDPKSVKLPSKDDGPLPLPDSPLQEKPDNSTDSNVVSRYDKWLKSLPADQVKVILGRTTSQQNFAKDSPVATETQVSVNDVLSSDFSQDSVEMSKEEDQPKVHKGSDSLFEGIARKSFREFSRSTEIIEDGRPNVFVNGQLIPEQVVGKAEKLAGTIQPGEYWYDFQAGFWGMMGQPCRGIIPPYMAEFNYPMPENCAAGNTGVFVNGRELNQKDLDLLAERGLPITKNKSYRVKISGKVLDEHTGEVLHSLGKLAPTVLRAKRGFGMKPPKEDAQ